MWAAAAALLFAFIYFVEPHLHKPASGPLKILADLNPAEVTSIQVLPRNQPEIRADLTNQVWRLTRPIDYPARGDMITLLLKALQALKPGASISADELRTIHSADEKFGFEPPQITLILQRGIDQTSIHIGHTNAPGDEVFLQVAGSGDAFAVDAGLLDLIPVRADQWRDRQFVDLIQIPFDRLLVTNAGQAFELRGNPTNHLWRMLLPGWEPRADSDKVIEALQRLENLRVGQFITDDPKAELDQYGLQTPELTLALATSTNTVMLLEFGRSPTNNAALQYARRTDLNAIVTVPKKALGDWSYELFRDRHLVTLATPVQSIELRGPDHFTLLSESDHEWSVEPDGRPGFPADTSLVQEFITNLTTMQIVEFPKDVVTAPDLPAWGLAPPRRQILLFGADSDTLSNANLIAQLDFGTNIEGKVFARRTDESSLYAVQESDVQRLPAVRWQFRDRRLWNFSESDVARISIRQGGKTRVIEHKGTNSWSLAAGNGFINDLAMEETAHRLGALTAAFWVAVGDQPQDPFGFGTDPHQVVVELKNTRKFAVEFGGTAPSGYPYARVTLGDQPWIFEFDWALYHQFVEPYLTIPAYIH